MSWVWLGPFFCCLLFFLAYSVFKVFVCSVQLYVFFRCLLARVFFALHFLLLSWAPIIILPIFVFTFYDVHEFLLRLLGNLRRSLLLGCGHDKRYPMHFVVQVLCQIMACFEFCSLRFVLKFIRSEDMIAHALKKIRFSFVICSP